MALQFTRTGYVEPNFFSSKGESSLIPVVTDEVTGGLVGWADRRNHRIFGMQAHPEIPLNVTPEALRVGVSSHVKRILNALQPGYGDEILTLEDQFFPETPIANPGIAFYSQALSTLADDLFYAIRYEAFMDFGFQNDGECDFDEMVAGYQGHLSLQSSSMSDASKISVSLRQIDYLHSVDSIGKVELLCHADWKVGRGKESYGDVCGADMVKLVRAQKAFSERSLGRTGFLTFNDFGAGNGTFLSEMRDEFEPDRQAFFY